MVSVAQYCCPFSLAALLAGDSSGRHFPNPAILVREGLSDIVMWNGIDADAPCLDRLIPLPKSRSPSSRRPSPCL